MPPLPPSRPPSRRRPALIVPPLWVPSAGAPDPPHSYPLLWPLANRPSVSPCVPRGSLPRPLPRLPLTCSAAEKAGLSLSKIEKLGLLSTAERLGLLSLAEDLLTTEPGTISSGGWVGRWV